MGRLCRALCMELNNQPMAANHDVQGRDPRRAAEHTQHLASEQEGSDVNTRIVTGRDLGCGMTDVNIPEAPKRMPQRH